MHPRTITFSLLLAGVAQAMVTNIACSTKYATTKRPTVPSTTDTFTFTRTVTHLSTTTPTVTATPAVMTTSVTTSTTSTIVVDYVSTDTYTTTQTSTSTSTSTETDSYTATSTTTTTSTTSTTYTAPTPAGFTPLASEPGFAPRRRTLDERDASFPARGEKLLAIPKLNAKGHAVTISQYPSAVSCDAFITTWKTTTVVKTASQPSTTTLVAQTYTSTQTVSTSTTSTSTLADATSFVTVPTSTTTTVTTTTSTTTTETDTATMILPTATAYAQCLPNNIENSALGQNIGYIHYNSAFTLASQYVVDTTGLGCCNVCATTADCAGYAQAPQGGVCFYILTDGRCSPTSSFGDVYHYYMVNGGGYTIGNGQCGFFNGVAGV